MTITEIATLVAKVQLGDNRDVDQLVIAYWFELIGDLDFTVALEALRRFRRERPGVYLEPGHLLELAGVVDVADSGIPDVTGEVLEESRVRMLAAAGVTEEEYAVHEHDVVWVRSKFAHLVDEKPALQDFKEFERE